MRTIQYVLGSPFDKREKRKVKQVLFTCQDLLS